jgi:hypothetical protein
MKSYLSKDHFVKSFWHKSFQSIYHRSTGSLVTKYAYANILWLSGLIVLISQHSSLVLDLNYHAD